MSFPLVPIGRDSSLEMIQARIAMAQLEVQNNIAMAQIQAQRYSADVARTCSLGHDAADVLIEAIHAHHGLRHHSALAEFENHDLTDSGRRRNRNGGYVRISVESW